MCAKKHCSECNGNIDICNCGCCCDCEPIIRPRKCPECPPCPPSIVNPAVPCSCSSRFRIKQIETIQITGTQETGLLNLKGSICKNCSNNSSTFTFSFVDKDLSNGNKSFTFVPTSINPFNCSISQVEGKEYLVQAMEIVGVYTPVEGAPEIVRGFFSLFDNTTPGEDDRVQIFIFPFDDFDTLVLVDLFVPENSVVVTQCK